MLPLKRLLLYAALAVVFAFAILFGFKVKLAIDLASLKDADLQFQICQLERRIKDLERNPVARFSKVTVTAYTPRAKETDSDPHLTATMRPIRPGIIAVSRDLLNNGWAFGSKVYIHQLGVFTIGDVMHPRWKKSIDIALFNLKEARNFGRRHDVAAILLKEKT